MLSTQLDPIGLAGGLNLYGFAGGDPVNFSDPFGLCPESMKQDANKCRQWNDAQIAKALAIIAAEQARGNQHALKVNAGDVMGGNESDVAANCPGTLTGCTGASGQISVSADRDPAAIAQTIIHEQQHIIGGADEPCAKHRGVLFIMNADHSVQSAAFLSRRPAYLSSGGSPARCGF